MFVSLCGRVFNRQACLAGVNLVYTGMLPTQCDPGWWRGAAVLSRCCPPG